MPSTNDYRDPKGLFALFKGDSGAGKSVAALSFPDPFVFDFDRKMPAIAMKHFPGKNVHWDTFNNVLEAGDQLTSFMQSGCPFETVILDSITSMSYSCIASIDQLKGQNILSMLRNTKPTKSGQGTTIELRGYDYYNGEDSMLKFFIDGLKFLWDRPGNPKHVIVIAHVLTKETQDIKTKVTTKTRSIVTSGKSIAAYIPAQFDEMYQFGILNDINNRDARVSHIVCTEGMGDDSAKTAYNLPGTIDFTNGSLYELIRNQIDFPGTSSPLAQIEATKSANFKL